MPKACEMRFEDITVGQEASFDVSITDTMVRSFADISGDFNPLHMDESYAAGTEFGRRIPHGFLGASFFSRLVGMHLPGRSALYLSQQLFFRKNLDIGMTLLIKGVVVQKIDAVRTIKIAMQASDRSTSTVLIEGEGLVKVLT